MRRLARLAAIELVVAAQAIDLRDGLKLGRGTGAAFAFVRSHVARLDEDRPTAPDFERLAAAILAGELGARARRGMSWALENYDRLADGARRTHRAGGDGARPLAGRSPSPVGIWTARRPALYVAAMTVTGVLYTIPALALFALLIPFMGLGKAPAITALVLYSLLILVRNIAIGIREVPAELIEAADGMGYGRGRRLRIELPLALPVIVAGIRITVVTQIAVATVAAYINAGGLGDIIFQGITQDFGEKIVAGAVLTSLLAIAADEALKQSSGACAPPRRSASDAGRHARLARWPTSRGLENRGQPASRALGHGPGRGHGLALPLALVLVRWTARAAGDRHGQRAAHHPSLALLVAILPLLGTGFLPSVIALTLYGLPAILINTHTALREVDPDVVEAGRGRA